MSKETDPMCVGEPALAGGAGTYGAGGALRHEMYGHPDTACPEIYVASGDEKVYKRRLLVRLDLCKSEGEVFAQGRIQDGVPELLERTGH